MQTVNDQQSYDQCKNSYNGAKVTITQTADSSFRIDGVTPECMDLAAMFTGSGSLYPCGSACLQHNNLDSEDVTNLQSTTQSLLN
ncbi:hypothetical protein N7504_008448 [Penicillium tannophilum]|nr:hypothetical protein N7504_008448 [Penicillium tannophilum]